MTEPGRAMHTDCGKIPYPTAASAWRAVRRIRHRLRAYPCQDCHQWHLTHQPNPKRPAPLDPVAAAKRLHRHWPRWEEAA